jgi:hypothetical protein
MEGKLSLQGLFLLVCLLIFSVPTVFAQGPCTVDADCDDGLYCTGVETCVSSVCQTGTDPCAPLDCDEEDHGYWEMDGSCIVDPPITHQFDFNGDEEWDTAWCLDMGETVDVAIWLDDYGSEEKLFGSIWFFVNYDDNYLQLNAENSYIYDTDNGGPWLASWSIFDDVGGGGIVFELRAASIWGVEPTDGKVKLAVVQLERIGATPPPGDAQIGTEEGSVVDFGARVFIVSDADATIGYCDDGNVCTADSCDPETGECIQDPAPYNGNACDDGDPCTVNDICDDGTCGGTAKDCSSLDDQCNMGACDPGTGDCIQDSTSYNGDPCDDGVLCTVDDTCNNGACSGIGKDCSSLNDQCNAGICDTGTGNCIENPTPYNGNSCDDGSQGTLNDTCSDGVCAGSIGAASIPTLSEWGMIIFMTIIVGISVIVLSRRRMV